MKMNAGVWIGIIGGIIGLVVGMGAVIGTTGSAGIYIALGMLLFFGGMFYLFYRLFFKSIINTNRLQKTGLPGKARIVEVRDTGVTINNSPQVKLILEVKNSFGQTYTTQCRVLVSRINPGAYMPGMEIPIKIDPKNEMNVAVDFTGGKSSVTAGVVTHSNTFHTAALQDELLKMQQENQAISASGKPAKAIVTKYTWLGTYVNGNNPYVELEVQVLPELSPAYGAKTRGVIAEASVAKFQPGCTIHVKYDMYDNTKVVIEHS